MTTRSLIVVAVTMLASAARADGVTQPMVSPDDVGTDSYLTRYAIRTDLGATYTSTPEGTAEVYGAQLALGPFGSTLPDWGTRFRMNVVDGSDTGWRAAPFTFALQHYWVLEPLNAAPLLGIHFGVEGAISTPWLSDRRAAPPAALTSLGIDTELANNGWSVRPSGYARMDFLGCRNEYVEVGAGPELFVPTTVGAPNLVAIRYRIALGADFGCDHKNLSQVARPGLMLEYRGRGIVYRGDASPSYDDLLNVAVQWVVGPCTLGFTYGFDPLLTTDRYVLGARLQLGFGGVR